MSEHMKLSGSPIPTDLYSVFGTVAMGLSLMVIAILLSFQGTAREAVTSKITIAFFVLVTDSLTERSSNDVLTWVSQYMIFFGSSLNAIPWCYAPEILPLKARAKGTSLAVMMNWVFVCLIKRVVGSKEA